MVEEFIIKISLWIIALWLGTFLFPKIFSIRNQIRDLVLVCFFNLTVIFLVTFSFVIGYWIFIHPLGFFQFPFDPLLVFGNFYADAICIILFCILSIVLRLKFKVESKASILHLERRIVLLILVFFSSASFLQTSRFLIIDFLKVKYSIWRGLSLRF